MPEVSHRSRPQALGFFFPVFWVVSAALPLCLRGRQVRLAGLASVFAALLYLLLAVVLAPTMAAVHSRDGGNM